MFLLIGLALLRTTLCACSRSFWGGAENRSSIGLLIWPAHLFRHFLRRVEGDEGKDEEMDETSRERNEEDKV